MLLSRVLLITVVLFVRFVGLLQLMILRSVSLAFLSSCLVCARPLVALHGARLENWVSLASCCFAVAAFWVGACCLVAFCLVYCLMVGSFWLLLVGLLLSG